MQAGFVPAGLFKWPQCHHKPFIRKLADRARRARCTLKDSMASAPSSTSAPSATSACVAPRARPCLVRMRQDHAAYGDTRLHTGRSANGAAGLSVLHLRHTVWILFVWCDVITRTRARARPIEISPFVHNLQVLIACKYCTKRIGGSGDFQWHLFLSPNVSHPSFRSSLCLSDSRHESACVCGQNCVSYSTWCETDFAKYCTKRTAGCGDVQWHLFLSPNVSHPSFRSSLCLSDSRHESACVCGQNCVSYSTWCETDFAKYCTKRTAGCGDVQWHLFLSPYGSHPSVRSSCA